MAKFTRIHTYIMHFFVESKLFTNRRATFVEESFYEIKMYSFLLTNCWKENWMDKQQFSCKIGI